MFALSIWVQLTPGKRHPALARETRLRGRSFCSSELKQLSSPWLDVLCSHPPLG